MSFRIYFDDFLCIITPYKNIFDAENIYTFASSNMLLKYDLYYTNKLCSLQ